MVIVPHTTIDAHAHCVLLLSHGHTITKTTRAEGWSASTTAAGTTTDSIPEHTHTTHGTASEEGG